ncbi:SHOCT domain-containing protein [Streptomyces sp. NPDC059070]|uniref:SHOCT domain-containing protein n=1 Tax=Streptomyces sp. NPDC059070 TaxID=3346713 RepID=UPI0036A87417
MDFPLLNAFLTMLWFFLWVMWLALLLRTFADIFRSSDLGGWAKTGWLLCVMFLPFLGVFAYLVARGEKMNEHSRQAARERESALRAYIREAAGGPTGDGATRLTQLADLRRAGDLTDEEYQRAKSRVLAS